LQPPPTEEDEGILEIGGCQKIGNHYYLVGGWFNMMGMTGYGTYTLIGDSPTGPFSPDPGFYRLCGNSLRWVAMWARFCQTDSELLVNGFFYDGYTYELGQTWLPPIKQAIVDENEHLRLGYWKGNEAIKGAEFPLNDASLVRLAGDIDARSVEEGFEIQAQPEVISLARVNQPTSISVFDKRIPAEKGLVVQGKLCASCKDPRLVAPSIGFYLEESDTDGTAIIFDSAGATQIGKCIIKEQEVEFNWEDTTGPGCASVCGCVTNKTHKFTLFIRGNMFEIYLDDMLVQTFNTAYSPEVPGRFPRRLGFIVRNGIGRFSDLKVWEMNL